jgi:myosin-crossreactive antigen
MTPEELEEKYLIRLDREMENFDICESIYQILEMKDPKESALKLIEEDSKNLGDDSLDDCIDLVKKSTSPIAAEALEILTKEKEDRKSRRQSESWLDDVFGGED